MNTGLRLMSKNNDIKDIGKLGQLKPPASLMIKIKGEFASGLSLINIYIIFFIVLLNLIDFIEIKIFFIFCLFLLIGESNI